MAATSSIRAGRAFVELFADNSKLIAGLRLAERRLKAFGQKLRQIGTGVMGVGAALAAPLVAAAKHFSTFGDQVAKMAKRTGLSVETLSEMRFVASQTGTEFGSLEMAFRKMQRSIYDAGRGMSTQTEALKDLGLTFEDLNGLSPEAQFKLLADRIGRIEDPTKKAAIAMTLFGRTGTNLLPMFAAGAKGIEALQEQARKLGLTMSSEDAKAAEDFTDALDALWKTVKMVTFQVGAALAPALQASATFITRIVSVVIQWVKANREIVVMVGAIAGIIIGVGAAIVAFGGILTGVGMILGVVATALSTVGAVLGALLSPIGLVIAAVATLGTYLLTSTELGVKAIAWLGGKFGELKGFVTDTLGGIADAIATGDFKMASEILWLSMKVVWLEGVNFLKSQWLAFKDFFVGVAVDAWTGALATLETVLYAIDVAWIETVSFLSKTWHSFAGAFAKSWEWMKAAAAKVWNWIKSLFSDFDEEAANAAINADLDSRFAQIDNESQAAADEAERKRQAKRNQSKSLHDATMAELGKDNLDEHERMDRESQKQIKEAEEKLRKAKEDRQKALEEAKRKRQEKGPDESGRPESQLHAQTSQVSSVIHRTADVIGSFNVASLLGFQAATADERVVASLESIEKNTRTLRDMSGAEFG